jgi:hypothetical protein
MFSKSQVAPPLKRNLAWDASSTAQCVVLVPVPVRVTDLA